MMCILKYWDDAHAGNANTRKIDEVENLKVSGVSTENTIGCNLLLTLDTWSKASYLIAFVQ